MAWLTGTPVFEGLNGCLVTAGPGALRRIAGSQTPSGVPGIEVQR
jgi:hypothetical protein